MFTFLGGLVVGAVAGFVAGLLVFRKHQAKLNEVEGVVKDAVKEVKK